jgi:hypothetical protein
MAKEVSEKQKISKNFTVFGRLNGWLAAVYTLQGIFMLLLSSTKLLPIEISYITADPIATELSGHSMAALAMHHLTDINLAYLLSAVFFAAALAHLAAATVCRRSYEAGLGKRLDTIRWCEYAFSSGVLTVAIAMLAGARDVVALGLLFLAAVVVGLVLLALEVSRNNSTVFVRRLLVGLGVLVDAALWLGLSAYLWNTGVYGAGGLPVFMYGLAGSALVLFVLVGVVMYLSWRKIDRWANYACVERTYMMLGLVTKTALVWQIFAGVLRT